MYQAHPLFAQPDNDAVKVWRYMDFTKLVSLIDSRRLYFTRADKFHDPFEGSWPKTDVDSRQSMVADVPPEMREALAKQMGEMSERLPRFMAINCWHMNDYESAAMWKLYLKSDEGIAVQSSYKSLRDSIIDDEKVYLGVIKYIDYETEWITNSGNVFSPFLHKRRSFEHEREVRAVVVKWPVVGEEMDFKQETMEHGVKIKVDLERLIHKIYVAPSAPNWFADLVKALVQKYGYNFEVVRSKLDDKPLF